MTFDPHKFIRISTVKDSKMKAHKYEEKPMNTESRIVRVETVIEHIQYMLNRIEQRFDTLDGRINDLSSDMKEGYEKLNTKIDTCIGSLEKKIGNDIGRLETKIDTNFKWVVGMMITLFVLNGFVPVISKLITNLITT